MADGKFLAEEAFLVAKVRFMTECKLATFPGVMT